MQEPDGSPLDVGWILSIWGPLRVTERGSEISLRPRERAMLAALVMDHPSPVTVGDLVDRVWGHEAPPSAVKSIHNHVARVRAVAPGLIVTDTTGYRLAPSVEIAAPSIDELESQLPYSDLSSVSGVVSRRERMVRACWHEHFEALRGDGSAAHLRSSLSGLTRFVEVHPDHDDAIEVLGRALAHSSRRSEAIRILADRQNELVASGRRPNRALRDLERRLLDDALVLDGANEPLEMVGAGEHLIEFEHHVDLLEASVDPGASRLVVVSGPAGIGKTTLVELVRDRAASTGRVAVLVGCSPEPSVPLEPIVDLLHHLVDRFPTDAVRGADAAALRALAPELPLPDEVGRSTTPPDRSAIMTAVVQVLSSIPVPLVVIIEDLHWATTLTTRIVAACATELSSGAGVTVIGTARTAPPSLLQVANEHLVIEPWDPSTVHEFVAGFGRSTVWTADAATWVHQQSGGNALHVRELTLAACNEAEGSVDADVFEPPADAPPNLLSSLRVALAGLSPSTRRDLGAAAVLGRRFRRAEWGAMVADVDRAMDDAAAAGVLVDVRSRPGASYDVEFRHDLLHQLVSDELSSGQRVEWHDLALLAIEQQADAELRTDELARHAVGAATLDPLRATRALRRAVDADTERFSYETAIDRCRFGIELSGDGGIASDPSTAVAFEVRLGKLQLRLGLPEAIDTLLTAASNALDTGDDRLVAEAIREACRLGPTSVVGSVDHDAGHLLDRALETVVDAEAMAIVSTAGVMLYAVSGEYDRCREHFDRALAHHGDDETRAETLALAVLVMTERGDIPRRLELEQELLELAERVGTVDAAWGAQHLRMTDQVQLGDPGQRSTLRTLTDLATASRQRTRLWELRNWSASVALTDGDPAAAEALAGQALECLDAVAESLVMSAYGAQLLAIRHAEGRVAELLEMVATIVDDGEAIGAWHAVLALAAAESGEREQASAAIRRVVADDFALLERDYTFNGALFVAALATCRIGDRGLGAVIEEALREWSGLWAFVGTCTMGPIDVALAELALLRGDASAAIDLARRAHEAAESAAAPIYRAQALELLERSRSAGGAASQAR